MEITGRTHALDAVGSRVSRKLESLLGFTKADELARTILAQLELDALRSPRDTYRFGELLRERGGALKVLGCSLQTQALIEGAIPDLGAAPTARRFEVERLAIASEIDVSRVRVRAHEIARALGAGSLAAQRVATATSELARNIVAYAGSGWIEILTPAGRRVITLRAIDRGPGIADLALVLSGRYRSSTGLGRGLSGVKRLASRFDVATGPSGTTAEAEFELWGQLVVPLQGEIRDSQMTDLSQRVLARIRDRGAEGLVLDASGVWLMDSHFCATLGRLARAARLMGTQPVLCGLSPDVVMTLLAMGIDLEGIETAIGLEEALERLGLSLSSDTPVNEHDGDEIADGEHADVPPEARVAGVGERRGRAVDEAREG